jgi:3' terminal RNA ribose 2'-O-methyltransferase Hen1
MGLTMLLTITMTHRPATDLGYLLHKRPDRCQSFPLSFGQAHVFYPEATDARCTAALLLDVDPGGLVRDRRSATDAPLAAYVSDRPYVASSFLSVAIAGVYGTALAGRCNARPQLAGSPIPLEARLAVLPCHGGEPLLRRLFEPLGYAVAVDGHPLDERFPEWGQSHYFTVTLSGTCRLADLLGHLYVLVPVLDREKHYFVGEDEVEKLLRRGAGWLAGHPERDLIVDRYLRHRRRLADLALARLLESGLEEDEGALGEGVDPREAEGFTSLNEQRLNAVVAALKRASAHRVLDLGCGEGRLLQRLLDDPSFAEIVGVDVSYRELEKAHERLRLERMPERKRSRIKLMQGSLVYRDERLAGYDAAAVVEVVEHLDPPRLPAFERALFEFARPETVVLTTPNAEYNVRFGETPRMRHRDHRFEWTSTEFRSWATGVADRTGYAARFLPVGTEDPVLGPPTQMAVFTR